MEYLLKSAAVLTLFYGVYKIFLERETFFQSLRAYPVSYTHLTLPTN